MRILLVLLLIPALARADDELDALRKRLEELERTVEADKAKRAELEQEIERLKSRELESEVERYLTLTGEGAAERIRTAGYDDGFFIQSPDERYRLTIGAYTQVRYQYNSRRSASDGGSRNERGWSLPRTRIILDALLGARVETKLELEINVDGNVSLINGYLDWRSPSGWHFRVGQQYIAQSREDWQDPEHLLTPEYSAYDNVFALGTSIGLQAHRTWTVHRGWLAFSNGRSGGRTDFTDQRVADWAFSGRWEWQFATRNWSVWDDMIGRRGRAYGWLLGVAGNYQGGVRQGPIREGGEVILDLSVNGDGFHAYIGGTVLFTTQVNDPAPRNFTTWGVLAQGGYFVAEKWQIWAQYDAVYQGDATFATEDFQAIGVGVNFFPLVQTNRQKFTLELRYLFSAIDNTLVTPSPSIGFLPSGSSGQFLLRLQFQFGF